MRYKHYRQPFMVTWFLNGSREHIGTPESSTQVEVCDMSEGVGILDVFGNSEAHLGLLC